ncbi:S26 family signal peptidase [soil metagenome]
MLLASRDRIAPRLMFNTTASAPVGFYSLQPGAPRVGEWVAIKPPPHLAQWMSRRHYLPVNVPLLKQVAARPGQEVCGRNDTFWIDGQPIARVRRADRWGRALPIYSGCHCLTSAEVLVVNRAAADSLDSRYFGPLPALGVIGRARPLWTWEARR